MPIHSAGYRGWEGRRLSGATRWSVIARTGIRRAWKSKWLRRMMFLTFLPTVFMAIPLFLYEQSFRDPGLQREAVGFFRSMPQTQALAGSLDVNPLTSTPEEIAESRHQIWSYLLLMMFQYPQATLMVLVIGIAAPPLISNDVRSRAFLIYFSRPITRLEYLMGKMGTMVFFLLMITTLPALLLYFAGVMLSPNFNVLSETWDLPFRIMLASAVLILPTTSLALMFSSMTSESRYAGFAWYAIWILGYVMFSIVMAFTYASLGYASRRQPLTPDELPTPGWKKLLSPYHTLGEVQKWIFDLPTESEALIPAAILLALITIVSLGILYRRISAPMRA